MKIITRGKIKDFYDYLMGVLGQDELVVYDRRECFPIDPTKKWDNCYDSKHCYPCSCSDYQNSNIEKWFSKNRVYGDKKRETIHRWSTKKVLEYKEQKEATEGLSWRKKDSVRNSWQDIIDDEDENRIHLNYGLIEKKDISKDEKISYAPICLCPISHHKYWYAGSNDRFEVSERDREQAIHNPILYSTYIPKFIDAYEMWNNLYEYISSLRDKEFTDTRTNDQHIESHGFDKKISFRHRK